MTLFKPAIALMNRLKYPQKFFLISLLFVIPLALVMGLLITELDSRIEFTQKEIYGTRYLRPINRLWQYLPERQLFLQRQSYQQSQLSNESQSDQKIESLEIKINQEFETLSELEIELSKELNLEQKLKRLKERWRILVDSQEKLGFRSHDLLINEINALHRYIVDYSNLILDPDLDTYYLMDAISFKLPEMQRLLYKITQTEAEIIYTKSITPEKMASLISLTSLLGDYNEKLAVNLERAFQNNSSPKLRNALSELKRNFVLQVSEVNTYISQLMSQGVTSFSQPNLYKNEMEATFDSSFILWEKVNQNLKELLMQRVQRFRDRRVFIIAFVIVILICIVYLFIGFYLSVMRTIKQLDMAAKEMTTRGEIFTNIDSRDELSMVVRSFNSIAIALKESEEKYRSIFENSVDGIFQTTVDGRYLSGNPALAKIYGYASVEEMIDQVQNIASDLYVESDRRQKFQQIMQEQDTITGFESQVYRRDRSTIWISENVRAIRSDNGEILYYEGTVEDITQRKLAEINLEKANQQILSLNNLLKEENLRMSGELEVTRRLQKMILPKEHELALVIGLDIAGFMEPAAEVGGDYYDVLQQNGRIKIGIGDVTGHGLESGMLMIMVQTAVRTLLQNDENDPVRFLDILNRTIYGNVQRMDSDKNLTLALIDYEHGKLTLSGQHEEMIVVRKNGVVERFDTIDLGFPIGLEEEIADFLSQKCIHLATGDVVVLYTDGITEAANEVNQMYGVDRLCKVIRNNVDQPAIAIRRAVINDLRSHIGTQKVYDDITLLVLKQK
ncbi:MAG: diguanylate cyclase [Pseudanabaena sp.]|nr:MAG: diguanylate cyclase [Pseudanabaena sp.]